MCRNAFNQTFRSILMIFSAVLLCVPLAACGVSVPTESPAPSATANTVPDYVEDDSGDIGDFSNTGGFNSEDYVPDAETARKLAEVYLPNALGETAFEDVKPITAALNSTGNIWEIRGSKAETAAPLITIWKKDGAVEITQGKNGDLIPDAKTAYDVLGVFLTRMQGDHWLGQRPFHVLYDQNRGLWCMRGTVLHPETTGTGASAGLINAFIRKKDGCVMLIALDAD